MIFTRAHLDRLHDILRDAARREVMPRFRRLEPGDVRRKKSALDLVTEADEAAERYICAELAQAFPGAVLIGEEGVAANPDLLRRLPDARLAFVIDPIDGTMNFASELPLFAVMAAAVVNGEIVAAAIHDPVVDDTALALRGEGAWRARADGTTSDLRVAAPQDDCSAMAGMASWQYFDEPLRASLPARFPFFAAVSSLRCCGHEYRIAAAGGCDFLLYGSLNPWDHAPGSLIFTEAGGYARLLDGSAYRVSSSGAGILCASDETAWRRVRAMLLT